MTEFFDSEGLPRALDGNRVDVLLGELTDHPRYDKKESLEAIARLQLELSLVHQAYVRQGRRAMIVVEGTDAAGKGGTIRRMSVALDPHHAHVWPIAAPQYEERDHHYLYRFWKRLPVVGEVSIFDRSWYGRLLVERVEGLAQRREWQRAYAEINHFERLLVDDGIRIVKCFLHLTRDEQESRFIDRLSKPAKRWKLNASDFISRQHWSDYQLAYQDMLEQTTTAYAPWYIVPADSKPFARVAVMRAVLEELERDVDTSRMHEVTEDVQQAAEGLFGKSQVRKMLANED